jgi:hypothetical protein
MANEVELKNIPTGDPQSDPPMIDETNVAPRFARKSSLKLFPGNTLVGNWQFTAQAACTLKNPSGIFIPRIKEKIDFVSCPDGDIVVRVTLG